VVPGAGRPVRFQVVDQTYELGAGGSILGPRGIPHAFRNLTETARMIVTFIPAGSMEAFFATQMVDPTSEAFRDLSRKPGMEVVGPPLPP